MIILLNREAPIRFPSLFHRIRRWSDEALSLRRYRSRLGGAEVVAQNLLKELAMQHSIHWAQSYRDNPENATIDTIWVVRGAGDLRWAIKNKKRLGARELWAGPNITVVPQEKGGILLSPEIDRILTPSLWVTELYKAQSPVLRNKVYTWPVGIDTDTWAPVGTDQTTLLIYDKNQNALAAEIVRTLRDRSIPYRLIRYGSYNPGDFRDLLRKAWGMIWLSASESEGLALLECLSMNRPVLAWNPGQLHYRSQELQKDFTCNASSVPYFDERCGETFATSDQFPDRLQIFQRRLPEYQPRQYILDHHLDLRTNLEGWHLTADRTTS